MNARSSPSAMKVVPRSKSKELKSVDGIRLATWKVVAIVVHGMKSMGPVTIAHGRYVDARPSAIDPDNCR